MHDFCSFSGTKCVFGTKPTAQYSRAQLLPSYWRENGAGHREKTNFGFWAEIGRRTRHAQQINMFEKGCVVVFLLLCELNLFCLFEIHCLPETNLGRFTCFPQQLHKSAGIIKQRRMD